MAVTKLLCGAHLDHTGIAWFIRFLQLVESMPAWVKAVTKAQRTYQILRFWISCFQIQLLSETVKHMLSFVTIKLYDMQMLNRSNWASFLSFFMCYLCDFQRGSSSKAATSPAENYNLARRRTLQVVVSALLTECGFESAEKVAVETLTEMMQSCTYIYPYPVCWCHQNHIQYSFLKNYGSPVGQWKFFF